MNIIWLRQSQKKWAIIPAILIIALLSGSASLTGKENEANTTVSISEQAMSRQENRGILKEANTIVNVESQMNGNVLEIILTGDGAITSYKTFVLDNPNRLVVDVFNITKPFPQRLLKVDSPYIDRIRMGTHPNKVRLVLESFKKQIPSYRVAQRDNQLLLFLNEIQKSETQEVMAKSSAIKLADVKQVGKGKPGVIAASPQPKTKFSESQTIPAAPTMSKVKKKSKSHTKQNKTQTRARRTQRFQPGMYRGETPLELPGTRKRFRGTRISMDFYNADIHNVFRLISDISGLNIVVGDDVKGKVTLRLIDVPWDQALDLVLATQGLGMVRVGNVIRIAPAEALRKEQDMAARAAEARLDARKKKEELEPLITEYVQVNYAKAEELVPRVEEVLSERGKVTFDERTNVLIVHDIGKSIKNVLFLVKTLDRITPQVMIEARIVEAEATFARELGINWSAAYYRKDLTAGGALPFGGRTFNNLTGIEPAVDLPVGGPSGTLGFMYSRLGENMWSVDAQLSALEEEGKVKIISAPKIATLDNKEAMIKQGKEIPYLEFTEEGTVSTVFKEVVLELTVTPHITPDGRVRMKIVTKKDDLDYANAVTISGGLVPALDKKEAETELLVNDGETVVIGGVMREKETILEKRVPFLWKIPLLGYLFRYKKIEKEKTELLIFLAPSIIKEQREVAFLGQS